MLLCCPGPHSWLPCLPGPLGLAYAAGTPLVSQKFMGLGFTSVFITHLFCTFPFTASPCLPWLSASLILVCVPHVSAQPAEQSLTPRFPVSSLLKHTLDDLNSSLMSTVFETFLCYFLSFLIQVSKAFYNCV